MFSLFLLLFSVFTIYSFSFSLSFPSGIFPVLSLPHYSLLSLFSSFSLVLSLFPFPQAFLWIPFPCSLVSFSFYLLHSLSSLFPSPFHFLSAFCFSDSNFALIQFHAFPSLPHACVIKASALAYCCPAGVAALCCVTKSLLRFL